jgi:hypothetical protein
VIVYAYHLPDAGNPNLAAQFTSPASELHSGRFNVWQPQTKTPTIDSNGDQIAFFPRQMPDLCCALRNGMNYASEKLRY